MSIILFQEQQKSKILQESMQKLDAEIKRTDSLLYQMIPKQVADRLRRGEPAITTCEVIESDNYGFGSTRLLKTPWENEKFLVTRNFSFSHSVFLTNLSAIFIKFEIVISKLFQFRRV